MNRILSTALIGLLAAPAFADSDPGMKAFNKCKSCHSVISDGGDVIVKGGKTGPNLYGVAGRAAGSADYKYGDGLVAAGEKGLVWDEESFAAFTADPKGFLKEYLGDDSAKTKMSFKLKKGAEDIYAFLEDAASE